MQWLNLCCLMCCSVFMFYNMFLNITLVWAFHGGG